MIIKLKYIDGKIEEREVHAPNFGAIHLKNKDGTIKHAFVYMRPSSVCDYTPHHNFEEVNFVSIQQIDNDSKPIIDTELVS